MFIKQKQYPARCHSCAGRNRVYEITHAHCCTIYVKKRKTSQNTDTPALRATPLARGELRLQQERSKFSSCGGVPRSGEVVFFTTLRILKTTPALRATPPPEGNLDRNGRKQVRRWRTICYLCSLIYALFFCQWVGVVINIGDFSHIYLGI